MRPVRQQGRAFYLTALIITLLACYSFFREYTHGPYSDAGNLAVRSLETRDLEVLFPPNNDHLSQQLRNVSADSSIMRPTSAHSSKKTARTKKQA